MSSTPREAKALEGAVADLSAEPGSGGDREIRKGPQEPKSSARSVRIVAAVAAGGFFGAPARYELARAIHSSSGGFPTAIFLVNVSGSFALGAILTLIVERWPPNRYLRPFVATGFIGAYTTWSTFMVDSDVLLKRGHLETAAAYVVATLLVGLSATYGGMRAARLRPALPQRGPHSRRRPGGARQVFRPSAPGRSSNR